MAPHDFARDVDCTTLGLLTNKTISHTGIANEGPGAPHKVCESVRKKQKF
jgi:hypothetical protein